MTAQEIEQIDEVDAYYDKEKIRPLQGGCYTERVSGIDIIYGSIGCAVTYTGPDGGPDGSNASLKHGGTYALSAEHVVGPVGTGVGQPYDIDNDRIGWVQLAVSGKENEHGDFAISDLLHYDDKFLPQIIGLGAVLGEHDITDDEVGHYPVSKRGSETGITHGRVTASHQTLTFVDGDRKYELKGLLEITATEGTFGENGDSGSVVVSIQNQVVGLLVAATADFTRGYAVPIARIREDLQIKTLAAKLSFKGGPSRRVPSGTDKAILILTLPAPAPHAGLMLDLTTDNPAVAKVPARAAFPGLATRSLPILVERVSAGKAVIKAVATHVPDLETPLDLYFE
ncbi:hypothetical protein GCM10009554_41390 [Kribbella koreensis]|uniref:Serine protease n=1 Tax=Kribbella koreensis TaxID=57909 RepID=A0ABN1QQF4_9ACTN